MNEVIYEAQAVTKIYKRRGSGWFGLGAHGLRAVDKVSVTLRTGEVSALIGESGSGKSTLGRMLAMLELPDEGKLVYEGKDLAGYDKAGLSELRRKIQLVFQDPYDSLDPRYPVWKTVEEPLLPLGLAPSERVERVERVLADVELKPVERYFDRMPHELSGGQRQRVAIARALILEPSVLIADEPTSMLDVSVRAGIVNLLIAMTRQRGISVLLITHDLAIARYAASHVSVMNAGVVVESGPAAGVIANPQHAFTKMLLDATPTLRPLRVLPAPSL